MKDPFLQLYTDIQEIWNDKKGLPYTNKGGQKRILKRLEKFVDTLDDRTKSLKKEIEFLKS